MSRSIADIADEQHHAVLSEDQLRHIARNVASLAVDEDGRHNTNNGFTNVLENVFAAAEARKITAIHRVAAWNALSAIVDHAGELSLLSAEPQVDIWKRSFDLYIGHSQNARPKSSKQLLSSLASTLRRCHMRATLSRYSAKRIIESVRHDSSPNFAKAALQALAQFLGKHALSLNEILQGLGIGRIGLHQGSGITAVQKLIVLLLRWVGKGDFGSVVAHVLSVVLQAIETDEDLFEITHGEEPAHDPLWMQPLEDAIQEDSVKIDDLRAHIFPVLFKRDLQDYIRFLDRHGFQQMQSIAGSSCSNTMASTPQQNNELLCVALQTGKELGLLYDTPDKEVSQTSTGILLPVRYICQLLSQQSRQSRLTGLSLLITSHSVTKPFLSLTLEALKKHLHIFFADADANFRSELFSLMQKLIDRLRAITAVLARKGAEHSHSDRVANARRPPILEAHHSFLLWLLSFLNSELRPTASYQRHISSLKTLVIISRSGLDNTVAVSCLSKSATAETKWPFHLPIMTPGLRRLLLDLLLDPFDDVRQTSALVLDLCSEPNIDSDRTVLLEELRDAIGRAEELMLLTGRADQADGVARLYALHYRQCLSSAVQSEESRTNSETSLLTHLLDKSEHMLGIAKCDLSTAVSQYPLHGLLSSFRYILAQQHHGVEHRYLTTRLVWCLQGVWDVVHPVLCDDAPEGYLPEQNETSDVSTMDTLSFCWRALKESSLLMGTMASNLSLDEKALHMLGNLCFRQLAELRHRGAFSTVAQTWILCCARCTSLTAANGQGTLQYWYEQTLNLLSNKATINTRRSAGIPALLCGLLIADKSGHLLPRAFADLANISRQPVDQLDANLGSLAQVHALNCIKDILKSTRLGEQSEQYVPLSMRLAAESLRSEAWAVRNCGLMLFRAVIDRLFGTSDAHLEGSVSTYSRFSIDQYPELLEVIVELLNSPQITASEGIFPTLQFLQHMDIPNVARSKTSAVVLSLTASKSWHIRNKAAQTYARMIADEKIASNILQRIQSTRTWNVGHNALHGILLCIKYLIRKLSEISHADANAQCFPSGYELEIPSIASDQWLSSLLAASDLYYQSRCIFTKAAYVDAITETIRYALNRADRYPSQRAFNSPINAAINIQHELKSILHQSRFRPDEHALRSALARAFAYQLRSQESELAVDDTEAVHSISLIILLARTDADACRLLLNTFSELQMNTKWSRVMLSTSVKILELEVDMSLKCEAQRLLLSVRDKNWVSTPDCTLYTFPRDRNSTATPSPFTANTNQEYADQWLQLQAVALEQRYYQRCDDDVLEEAKLGLRLWMSNCCVAIRGHGIFTREAAALATHHMIFSWQHMDNVDELLFCDLCFGICDLLNDDDEDIRSLAAASAACIVGVSSKQRQQVVLEPSCASERLAKSMLERWAGYPPFITRAAWRAFGMSDSQCVNVDEQLSMAETTDPALFAEERQNLYIDDAREVKFWTQVLLRVDASSMPKPLARNLCSWVSNGLDILTTRAEKQRDCALGWTSKAAVFTLGLQVILGADVLLHLVELGVRMPIPPSTLRWKLVKFRACARASEVNALWLREIDRVVELAVIRSLRCRKAVLEQVAGRK